MPDQRSDIDRKPDLNTDFYKACAGVPAFGDVCEGVTDFWLDGLYQLSLCAGCLELEFTETDTLRRSVIRVAENYPVFLSLPPANYRIYYRLLSGFDDNLPIRIQAQRVELAQRLALYVRKIVSLHRLSPVEALKKVKAGLWGKRHKAAVGLSLGRAEAPMRRVRDYSITPAPPVSPLPADTLVSIIIPSKDRFDLLKACVESLSLIRFPAYEVIIIDNGSETAEMQACLQALRQRPEVRVFRHDIPFNFSRLCNLGAAEAAHDWLLFLNDDTEALEGRWLEALCAQALAKDVGITGARLLYPSGDLQHAGIASHLLPGPGHPWRGAPESLWRSHPLLSQACEVDAVTGACLMVTKSLFWQLGGFNETDFAISLNDVDLCLRARECGYRVIYTPEATLLHKEGQSRRADDHESEQPRRQSELRAFVRRHPVAARRSVYYPPALPRDTDQGDI